MVPEVFQGSDMKLNCMKSLLGLLGLGETGDAARNLAIGDRPGVEE